MFKELFQTTNKVKENKGIGGITAVNVTVTEKSLNKQRSKNNLAAPNKNKFSSSAVIVNA